ncbi:unnamed protein product [Musa acuminata subsp. malaccensis]|uniref:(wild Malaysian banana) hypothetical protein n=1 Tax=Musa acuminata subsp. malaccensis TaxID=214687 RepID=A0A804JC81_MUSAM|nr:PREDICTED: NAC domain-containing protein 92-like [Musa acuminata subsp. malaccensis]CAG1845173.1 unnamed protein product [Musa acuminata subsp. malaccensis]
MEGRVEEEEQQLPPGFRFHPTDEELITHYLTHKITEADFDARAIAEVDLTKSEPWDLPEKAKLGEKEWYFFSLRDRKYPSGVRTNRATNAGYWKTTGKDKEIFDSSTSELVGMKKTLVFYKGRAPRGEKTNWIMHEYRLHSELASKYIKDEWVVCRVFMKSSSSGKKYPPSQPRANPYYVELGPVSTPSLIQNELMELSRFARDSHGPTSPIQPQLSYHGGGGGGGGGFTLAGMKLNMGALPPPPSPAAMPVPLFQPLGVAEPPPSSAIANGFVGAMDGGFGSDVRYHSMDSATELDVFWSPY